MPVLAACHLIYVFLVVLHCIVIYVVANKVLSLSIAEYKSIFRKSFFSCLPCLLVDKVDEQCSNCPPSAYTMQNKVETSYITRVNL